MNGSLPMLFVKSYNVYIYWHISFRFSLPKDVSDTCPGVARVLPCLRLAGHWQGMLRSPDPPRPPPEPGPAILRLRLPGQAESVQCIKCPGLPPSSHHLMVNTSVIELSPWYVICDCDDMGSVVTLTCDSDISDMRPSVSDSEAHLCISICMYRDVTQYSLRV